MTQVGSSNDLENIMAKNKAPQGHTTDQLRGISDYYRLNTKAVDDLAGANSENSADITQEELERYRSKSGIRIAGWLKAVLLKAWFAGAACFFIFWGLGTYVTNTLDMMVVFGVALGLVTDLLVNGIFRFAAPTPHANDRWMMFPKKNVIFLFLDILYAFLLLFCVYSLYQGINGAIVAVTGETDSVPLGVEPVLFGIFYMGFDMLFVSCKNLLCRIVSDAKKSVSAGGAHGKD